MKRIKSMLKIVLSILLSILILLVISVAVIQYYISTPLMSYTYSKLNGIEYRVIDIGTGAANQYREETSSGINVYIRRVDEKSFEQLIEFIAKFALDYKTVLKNHKMDNSNVNINSLAFRALTNTKGCIFCFYNKNYIKSYDGKCIRRIHMKNENGIVCFRETTYNRGDTCLSLEIPTYPY